jgi:hypothetical protein
MGAAFEKQPGARLFVPSVATLALLAAVGAAGAAPAPPVVAEYKWIHCANEGVYEGHHSGPFDLTRAVFESFQRNFRADPKYRTGELTLDDGSRYAGGVNGVLQFDYEHASEMPPWEGSIAQSGAPACGWALDVDVRTSADGKSQLWVFSKLGALLRGQIAADQYRSVSIAFTPDGVHWVTGKPIGPTLTSVAITNHPFLRDLEPLAAANRGPRTASQPTPGGAASQTRETTMEKELRERICKALRVVTTLDDAGVGQAVESAATSQSDLTSVLEALGVKNAGDALKQIPELKSALDKVSALQAELQQLFAQEQAADVSEIAPVDIGAAMSAKKYVGESAKKALLAYRTSLVGAELDTALAAKAAKTPESERDGVTLSLAEVRLARAKGRKAFLDEHGVKATEDASRAYLSQAHVAAPGGKQLETPKPLKLDERSSSDAIDLRGLAGANDLEKLDAYLCKTDEKHRSLAHNLRIHACAAMKRSGVQLITA